MWIYKLVSRMYVRQVDLSIADLVTNKVNINLKVLHFCMMYRILSNVYDAKIITKYHWSMKE